MSHMRRSLLLGACVVALSGCSDGPAAPDGAYADVQLVLVSGDGQVAPPGQELAQPLVAEVRGATGNPVPGILVNFRVVSGGGRAYAGVARTNAQGRVQDYWTLGPNPGAQVLEARAVRLGTKRVYATFNATAVVPATQQR